MKKNLSIFFLCFLFWQVSAQNIIVCDNCNFTNVSNAISNANTHDTIIVSKGLYKEHDIIIDKPLTLIGEEAIIDADFKGGCFNVIADSVSISGFTINNIKTSYTKDISGIYTFRISNFIFENNTFNNPFFAILIQKSENGIVRNNVINGNAKDEISSGNGIHLWHSNNVEIYGNTISQMRDGIYLEFVKNSNTYKNESRNHVRYGLHFMFSNSNSYQDNIFERNGAGVAVMFSKDIVMTNNIFQYNWGTASYGLLLKEIYDAEISNNTFIQNTIGINAEGSTRVNYFNNIFKSNGWATKITGGCYDNIFYNNDFLIHF